MIAKTLSRGKIVACLAILTSFCCSLPAAAQEREVRPELVRLSQDAFAFVTLRPGELWQTDIGRQFRLHYAKQAVEVRFGLGKLLLEDLAKVESVSFVFPTFTAAGVFPFFNNEDVPAEMRNLALVVLKRPGDVGKLARSVLGEWTEQTYKGKRFLVSSRSSPQPALYFINDRTYVLTCGSAGMIRAIDQLAQPPRPGPLDAALDLSKKHQLVAGMNLGDARFQELKKQLGGQLGGLEASDPLWTLAPLLEARYAAAALDVAGDVRAQASLTFADARHATEATAAARDAVDYLRLFVLARLRQQLRSTAAAGEDPQEMIFWSLLLQRAEASLRGATVQCRGPSVQLTAQEHFDVAALRDQAQAAARVMLAKAPEVKKPDIRIPDVKLPETKTPETKTPETKAPETKMPETKAPETKMPETKAPETKMPETKMPETKAPETKAPETKAPETKAPETKAPETKAPETKAPETKAPETKAPETKAPETKAPETKAPETKAPDTKEPETKAPDTKPVVKNISTPYGPAPATLGATSYFGATAAANMGSPGGNWLNHAQDWYAVPLTAGSNYIFTMTLTGAPGKAVLSLQNAGGAQVAFNSGPQTAQIAYKAAASEMCTVICSHDSPTKDAVPYTLAIPAPNVATIVTIDAPPVVAPNDAKVTVTVKTATGAAVPNGTVTLKVDDGAPVPQALTGGATTYTLTRPAVGNHNLVANYPGTAGFMASSSVNVVLTVNKAPETKAPDTKPVVKNISIPYGPAPATLGPTSYFGATAASNLGSPAGGWNDHGQDWYAVPLTAGSNYIFTMTLTGAPGKAVLSLQNAGGAQVAFNSGPTTAQIVYKAAASEMCTVICSHDSPTKDGVPYTLAIPAPNVATIVTIDAPPVVAPNDAKVTVTVKTATGAAVPNGTVTLKVDDGAPVPQALTGGATTYTLTRPAVGNHNLVANYPGTAGFMASSSVNVVLTVNKAPETKAPDTKPVVKNISIPYGPAPATLGPTSYFGATAASNLGSPAGGWNDHGQDWYAVPLTAGSNYIFTMTLTGAPGKAVLSLQNAGGAQVAFNSGPTTAQIVYKAAASEMCTVICSHDSPTKDGVPYTLAIPAPNVATIVTIDAPPVVAPNDAKVTVTVKTATGATVPNGTVTLKVDDGAPVPQALTGGATTYTLTRPAVGNHNLVANYPGTAGFMASSSVNVVLTVNKAPETKAPDTKPVVKNISIPYGPAPATLGPTSYFGATAASNLGSPAGGWMNHGQDWYAVPLTAGSSYVFTMTLTGAPGKAMLSLQNAGGAQVAFNSGPTTAQIAYKAAASEMCTVICSHDSPTKDVTPYTLTIPAANIATIVTIDAPAVIAPNNAKVIVTVKGASGTAMPQGTVTLSLDGAATVPQALTNGSTTYTLTGLAVGEHNLVATYPGGAGFLASSPVNAKLTVGKENKPPETKPPETKAPETKAPETKPPETKPPETKPPQPPGAVPAAKNITVPYGPVAATLGPNSYFGAAAAASVGVPSEGWSNHGQDWYTVTLTAQDTYRFDLVLTEGNAKAVLSLQNANGDQLAYNSGVKSAQIVHTPAMSGTYTIICSQDAATKANTPYTLAVPLPLQVVATTVSISAPAVVSPTDGKVTVIVKAVAKKAVPQGTVTLSVDGGDPVTQPLTAGSTTYTLTSPALGQHNLIVEYRGGQEGVTYSFLPATASATLLVTTRTADPKPPETKAPEAKAPPGAGPSVKNIPAPYGPAAATLGPTSYFGAAAAGNAGSPSGGWAEHGQDWYAVPLTALETYWFNMTPADANIKSVLSIQNSNGAQVAFNSGVKLAQIVFTPPATGTYTIICSQDAATKANTPYTLAITAPKLPVVTMLTITAPAVVAPNDGKVTVTVKAETGTAVPIGSVELSMDGGPAVTQTLAAGSTTFTITSPKPGIHFLKVSYSGGPGSNFYPYPRAGGTPASATLSVNPAPADAKPPETKAPETKAPEPKAPETRPPETKAPEPKAPEPRPPETKVPSAANDAFRAQSAVNLKEIMIALQRYHDSNRVFPPAAGLPGAPLSWRVHILPYIGELELYNEFDFTQPWDGPSNIKLLPRMPKIFASPGMATKEPFATLYQAVVGEGAAFEPSPAVGLHMSEFSDGTSATIGIVEAGDAVPWTKPADVVYHAKGLPKLGGLFADGFHAGFMDGSVRFFASNAGEVILRPLFTRAGGEKVDPSNLPPLR